MTAYSDQEGHFVIEDVRENALLEFLYPGFEAYYINTSFVPFNMDLTIELRKDSASDKDDVYVKAEKMPEYPGGDVATKEVLSQDKNKNEKTINTIIVDSQKISRNFQIKPYNFNPISLDGPRIIVIDGKVSEYGFDEIGPKYIQSLSVVKGEKATSLYGNKIANAVIIITTKRATNVTKDEKELNMK